MNEQLNDAKKLATVIADFGDKLGSARDIIKDFNDDYQRSQKKKAAVLNKLAECTDTEGHQLLPPTHVKEASACLGSHSGAMDIIYQLTEKIAGYQEALKQAKASPAITNIGSGVSKTASDSNSVEDRLKAAEEAQWSKFAAGNYRSNL